MLPPDTPTPPDPPPRVSLRDLALKLGVSASTVSRALKNHPRISSKLREKVRAAANDAGYHPDPMLRALSEYRKTKTAKRITAGLAWINHWPNPGALRSFREFDLYWQGAKEAAQRNGYHLEEYIWSEHRLSLGRLRQILLTRNVLGVLIPPHPGITLSWGDFDWSDFCVVRFGHSITTPHTHVVTSNQLLNARMAVEEMRKRGYSRIGFVTNEHMVRNTLALAGYLMERTANPQLTLEPLLMTSKSVQDQKSGLARWLDEKRPDALLSDIGELAVMLKDLGYAVPTQIALATMSVLDGGADAGIDQQSFEIGRAATEVVVSRISNHDTGIPACHRETLITGRWVDGKTLPVRRSV